MRSRVRNRTHGFVRGRGFGPSYSISMGKGVHMSYIRKIKKNGKVYLAEVEGKRINGKVVQKHIRYIGKKLITRKLSQSLQKICK